MTEPRITVLAEPSTEGMSATRHIHPDFEQAALGADGEFGICGIKADGDIMLVTEREPFPHPKPGALKGALTSTFFRRENAHLFISHAAWACGHFPPSCSFACFRHDGCWAMEEGSGELRWLPHSWMTAHERMAALAGFLERHGETLRRILQEGPTEDGKQP